ncbi:hypothetical protein RAB80_004730 [Fusarium oxysporum f. sp. vasinfectum]|nr:hypothetical protein RAB80_004730 [Fusarium oxysporum f. sp. vasinfectum]
MTVKGGFTSAGQPGPDSQHQHQVPASGHMPSPTATADLQSDASSSTVIAHADSHRQNHSSSKLPAFRFTDRRSSSCGSVPLANKGDPLSLSSSNQYNHNRNQNLDSRNNNKDDRTSDYLNHKPTTSASATASASTPTSPLANTLDSASAALSLQSSIVSSIVSPNSEPSTITPTVSVAPTTVSPVSADPGLVSPPRALLPINEHSIPILAAQRTQVIQRIRHNAALTKQFRAVLGSSIVIGDPTLAWG